MKGEAFDMMIPQLGAVVKAVPLPLYVKDKILDAVFATGSSAANDLLPADLLPADFLPADERVAEVLENGGFTLEKPRLFRQELYSYERVSRDGLPLKDEEAKRPPRYEMAAVGLLVCFCTCRSYRTSREACKHMKALTWWLTGQARTIAAGRKAGDGKKPMRCR